MATIGEETERELVSTNVTDDTPYLLDWMVSVDGNDTHTFAIKYDGTLLACGDNTYGQLGLDKDTVTGTTSFTQVPDMDNAKAVITGKYFTYVLKDDGTLWSTGRNQLGQLGLGDNVDRTVFTDTKMKNVHSISANSTSVLVIKFDGSVWAVGDNAYGQLGLGADIFSINQFKYTEITDAVYVALGGVYSPASGGEAGFSFIIKDGGEVLSTGYNNEGQLGLGDTTHRNTFTANSMRDASKIKCGGSHSIALRFNGTIYGTGYNNSGQLGLTDNTDRNNFTSIPLSDVTEISCGENHSLAISLGMVHSAGDNTYGQLGLGNNTNQNTFNDTSLLGYGIVGKGNSSFYMASVNSLYATGDNSSGQLGIGNTTNGNSFVLISTPIKAYEYFKWTIYETGDIVQMGRKIYSVFCRDLLCPNKFISFSIVGEINPDKPFDCSNITPAILPSPMEYVVKAGEEFNAFTLAKVLATSITYSFTLPLGDPNYYLWKDGEPALSGGNGITKADTVVIDCNRDPIGIFSKYPTTVVYYAGVQMPVNSIVSISLTYPGNDVQLGDFTFNNTLTGGYTNMKFSHGIQDFNTYTPDAWGNIEEGIKAVVTKFNITVDIELANYDYVISLHESLIRQFITIDASDSINGAIDSENIFGSLIRRVRITSVTQNTIVKDGDLWKMAGVSLGVQEIT